MSTPGNTAWVGVTHNNIQTAQRGPSLVGDGPTMPARHKLWFNEEATLITVNKIDASGNPTASVEVFTHTLFP